MSGTTGKIAGIEWRTSEIAGRIGGTGVTLEGWPTGSRIGRIDGKIGATGGKMFAIGGKIVVIGGPAGPNQSGVGSTNHADP